MRTWERLVAALVGACPGKGALLPLSVLLFSLFVMAWPLLALAQDLPAAPTAVDTTSPQFWVALLTGAVGVLSGGGSLYKVQSSAASMLAIEARLAAVEQTIHTGSVNLPKEYVSKQELKEVLSQLREDNRTIRQETRGDLAEMRAEMKSMSAQQGRILQLLDKLGAD